MTPLHVTFDPIGFPMIWVEAIGAYFHWLPVTHLQFQCFLNSHHDVLPVGHEVDITTYCYRPFPRGETKTCAFFEALSPIHAQIYALWCGNAFSVATRDEWHRIFLALRKLPSFNPLSLLSKETLKEPVRILLERSQRVSATACRFTGREPALVDQMLMRIGILEWVDCRSSGKGWQGIGQVDQKIYHGGSALRSECLAPVPPGAHERGFGFRLIYRPEDGSQKMNCFLLHHDPLFPYQQ